MLRNPEAPKPAQVPNPEFRRANVNATNTKSNFSVAGKRTSVDDDELLEAGEHGQGVEQLAHFLVAPRPANELLRAAPAVQSLAAQIIRKKVKVKGFSKDGVLQGFLYLYFFKSG